MEWHSFFWGVGSLFAFEFALGFRTGFLKRTATAQALRARTEAAVADFERAGATIKKLAADLEARAKEWHP